MANELGTDVMAKMLKLTARRLQQLENEGVVQKSERGRWPMIPTLHAYIDYLRALATRGDVEGTTADAYTTERARLTKTKADIAELERQKLAGEVIPADAVQSAWAALLSVARTRLMGIGSKLAPRLKVLTTDNERKDAIDAEIIAALTALSGAHLDFTGDAQELDPGADPDGGPPGAAPPTEADGE